jgi:putative nucleotidyltransferase with HDIG domain
VASVLLIGPDRGRSSGLRSILREDGHRVRWIRSVSGWRSAERESLPELVVAATESADAVLSEGRTRVRGFPAPVLFVQGEGEFSRDLFVEERLIDRLEAPFMSEEFLARVDALVRVRRVILRAESSRRDRSRGDDPPNRFSALGDRLTALLGTRVPRYAKPVGPYMEVAARVADWADRRDAFEPGHAERVASYCGMMADGLGLEDGRANALLRAAMLHDIGKIAIPVEVLHQRGPLQDNQMRLVRTHAQKGANLLKALDRDDEVAVTVLYHHEMVDGSGYFGKSGNDIPLTSRVLAVAECYDAMVHSGVRERVSSDQALKRLHALKDSKYDEACVDALSRALEPKQTSIPVSRILPT